MNAHTPTMRGQELFELMQNEHGLTLLESEMHEIETVVARMLARDRATKPDEVLEALRALLDWGREHTSPLDPNSPHHLLIRAHNAIASAPDPQRMTDQPGELTIEHVLATMQNHAATVEKLTRKDATL